MATPDHIRNRYLRGGCLAFAIAAKRQTGMPIHVLIDTVDGREEWVHAFVADEDRNLAIDIRGGMTLDPSVIGQGAAISGTQSIIRATAAQARERMGLAPTRGEIAEARRAFQDYVEPGLKPEGPSLTMPG